MGNIISINPETCKKCLLCSEVCPNKIIVKDHSGNMTIRPDRSNLCFQCGQCMAVCATQSIVIEGLSYEHDFFSLPEQASHEKAFYDMIYSRRAIRNFKDKPVPVELLEKIVEAIGFAPPGFPPLKYKIVVVQNTGLIRKALPMMIKFYGQLVRAMGNPVARFFIKKEVGKRKFMVMQGHLMPLLKSRLSELRQGTEDTITRYAPAMILFLADKREEDISADIYIAATYGMLAAHAVGLGGSIMDLIPPAVERDKELRKLFRIPAEHEVVTSLIVGYPRYKYQRGIKRKLRGVEWL